MSDIILVRDNDGGGGLRQLIFVWTQRQKESTAFEVCWAEGVGKGKLGLGVVEPPMAMVVRLLLFVPCVLVQPDNSASTMSFDRAIKHHFEPFRKGYRFKEDNKEERFQCKYASTVVKAGRLWAAILLFLHIVVPLSFLSTEVGIWFHMAYVPNAVVAAVCFVLLGCMPPKHATIICSIAAVLISAGAGFQVNVHAREWMAEARNAGLSLVFEAVQGNAGATQQLETYLGRELAVHETDSKLILYGMQLILIVSLGLSQSTLMCAVLMPVCFAGFAFTIPHISIMGCIVRGTILVLGSAFTLQLAVMISTGRRSEFWFFEFFETSLKTAIEASRKADSILNHTLKNTMADAAGQIEMFLEHVGCSDNDAEHLQLCIASLYRGMRSCRHRQAYVQMAANTYEVSLQPVRLAEFVGRLVAGRRMRVQVPEGVLMLDATLCSLMLDNAISNAFRHGNPTDPAVRLTVTTEAITEGLRLTFVVANQADATKPVITQAFVDRVLKGTTGTLLQSRSPMSDGIGLKHAFLAAELLGMDVSLTQLGTDVRFTAQVAACVADGNDGAPEPHAPIDLSAFPPNLQVCVIDDSGASRQLLAHNLRSRITPNVHVFGDKATDVEAFIQKTIALGDVAILDQNLEFGAEANFLGTDIIARLLANQFKGLICVRSGNVAAEDVAFYHESGAHSVFGKDVPLRQVVEDLKVAYVKHAPEEAPVPVPTAACSSSYSHVPASASLMVSEPENGSNGSGAGIITLPFEDLGPLASSMFGTEEEGERRPGGQSEEAWHGKWNEGRDTQRDCNVNDSLGDTKRRSACSSLGSDVDLDGHLPPFRMLGPFTSSSSRRGTGDKGGREEQTEKSGRGRTAW